jgi:hypothetical protein
MQPPGELNRNEAAGYRFECFGRTKKSMLRDCFGAGLVGFVDLLTRMAGKRTSNEKKPFTSANACAIKFCESSP